MVPSFSCSHPPLYPLLLNAKVSCFFFTNILLTGPNGTPLHRHISMKTNPSSFEHPSLLLVPSAICLHTVVYIDSCTNRYKLQS